MGQLGDHSFNRTRGGPKSPASNMRAPAERLKGGIAFRLQSERISNGRGDYRSIIPASLAFAGYYLVAKIGFVLFQPHPVSVRWRPNSIRNQ